ncbi:MAG: peroxiredoxin family protein [Anaerolineae bacterium]
MALLDAGTPAPEIEAENLTGGPVKLADYKGKRPVVLVFPPVNVDPARINATKSIYQNLRDKVEIIAVQKTVPGKQMAKMFLQQMGVQFPVLLDESGAAFKAYGVEKPPAAFYINIDGEIVASGAEGDLDEIEAGVKEHLL